MNEQRAERMAQHSVEREVTASLGEHEVLLAFVDDDGAHAFRDWWQRHGVRAFIDWLGTDEADEVYG